MRLIDTWEDWGWVYNEPDFWRKEIDTICELHDVDIRQIENTFPGTHAVFFVNEDIVLKMYCPVRYNSCKLELALSSGPLAGNPLFPQVLFYGTSPSGYDYIAFTRLNGRPVRELPNKRLPEAAIGDLANAIAALHIETACIDDEHGLRCLVHYDLTDDHIYVDDGDRLAGIIDFGDARTDHPSADFPVLFINCLGCNDSSITLFRTAYDIGASCYRIDDADVARALRHHIYSDDIIACLRTRNTAYARVLLKLVEESIA